jgi:hypothetical protein
MTSISRSVAGWTVLDCSIGALIQSFYAYYADDPVAHSDKALLKTLTDVFDAAL